MGPLMSYSLYLQARYLQLDSLASNCRRYDSTADLVTSYLIRSGRPQPLSIRKCNT